MLRLNKGQKRFRSESPDITLLHEDNNYDENIHTLTSNKGDDHRMEQECIENVIVTDLNSQNKNNNEK